MTKQKVTSLHIADLLSIYEYHSKQFIKGMGDKHLHICQKIYVEYTERIKNMFNIEL